MLLSNLLTLSRCIRPLPSPTTASSPWGWGRNLSWPPHISPGGRQSLAHTGLPRFHSHPSRCSSPLSLHHLSSPLLFRIPQVAIGLPPSLGSSGGSWLSLLSQALRRSRPKSCAFPPETPPPGSWAPSPGRSLLSALLPLAAAAAAPAVGAVSPPVVARAPSGGGDTTPSCGCPS